MGKLMKEEDRKLTLEDLREIDDFKALSKLNEDGSYEVDLDFYNYVYEGDLEFYTETGFEGNLASIVSDDRGLHEDGFHRTLEWAHFIKGGEFLEIFKDGEKVWDGLLVTDYEKIFAEDRKPYFMALGVSTDDWEKWFGHEGGYKGKIYTLKPVLAEDDEYLKKYKGSNDDRN
jgi:hypothetical protein